MFGIIRKRKKEGQARGLSSAARSPSSAREPTDFERRVEGALDRVRPYLQRDGGNVELVQVAGNSVKLRMVGHCVGCASSQMTLQFGIERVLREEIPEIGEIIATW